LALAVPPQADQSVPEAAPLFFRLGLSALSRGQLSGRHVLPLPLPNRSGDPGHLCQHLPCPDSLCLSRLRQGFLRQERNGLRLGRSAVSGFDAAVEFVLEREGGFVDDPRDAGGATSFGITIATLQSAIFSGLVPAATTPATLTQDQAKAIYRKRYWDVCRCDEFPPAVAFALLDAAVNQGPITAVMLLQKALGVTADGVVGPKTLAAAEAVSMAGITEMCALRLIRYRRDTNAETFFAGWARRVLALHARCLLMGVA